MGNKNKFFAFFQTEEQFIRFALKYIEEHPAMLYKHDEDLRHFSRVFQADICSRDLSAGLALTPLPTTAPPTSTHCQWCRKKRAGTLYLAKDKEGK